MICPNMAAPYRSQISNVVGIGRVPSLQHILSLVKTMGFETRVAVATLCRLYVCSLYTVLCVFSPSNVGAFQHRASWGIFFYAVFGAILFYLRGNSWNTDRYRNTMHCTCTVQLYTKMLPRFRIFGTGPKSDGRAPGSFGYPCKHYLWCKFLM